ncbi:flagellar biosynthetic protein FliO [Microbacterium sp.]|uniref:FliO/MopB family protein n=1 Tax=Microbacterium sp. TaxID=51671 RepID=UPI002C6B2279|nr:flagellar biosynthetic protein FliO [Microbacterium sp.]HWK76585.1 flagellar biosynthetic protein FliO [Microbacterium sp.]
MLGLLWYLQRRFSRGASRRRDAQPITVLGRQSLGSKAQFVVVQTSDARYVLGVTEHGVSVIDRLDVDEDAEREDATASGIIANDASRHPEDASRHPDDATGASTAFDSILAGASDTGAPELRRRVRRRNDPLRGSIISPDTWRQTAEAFRRSR